MALVEVGQKRYTVKIKNGILSKSKMVYCQNQKRYTVKIKNGILSKSKTIYCQNQKRYTFFCQIKVFNFILTRLINAINYSHTLILKVYYASENRDPTKRKIDSILYVSGQLSPEPFAPAILKWRTGDEVGWKAKEMKFNIHELFINF